MRPHPYLRAYIGMAVYYLAWKYVVGFLNEEMGIAV